MEITSNYKIKNVAGNRAHASKDTRNERELHEAYLRNMSLLNALMMPAGITVPIL